MLTCAVLNQKGGVGKTTVTLALAEAAAGSGSRVLVVDVDPQNNAGECLCPDARDDARTTDDLFEADRAGCAADAARPSAWPGVDVIPSALALAHREREASLTILYRLRKALRGIDGYDLVLLDCPPSVGTLTVNALVAADVALIVTEPARASIKGIVETRETLEVVAGKDLNPRLRLAGIVVNAADNTKESRFREAEIADTFGDLAWTPAISKRAAIAAAYGANTALRRYGTPEARSVAALYDTLAARLLKETA